MDFPNIAARVAAAFPNAIVDQQAAAIDPWVEVAPASIAEVAKFLRDEPDLRFEQLSCITAVDYHDQPPKKGKKLAFEPHVQLLYHLYSYANKHYFLVKVKLPRWKNATPGELPELPTVSSIWRTADWHEREVFDLMGVRFLDHPDLRRILCPDDWVGYPLRKDYEMPLEYHGMRGR